jgi:hypothetical protein
MLRRKHGGDGGGDGGVPNLWRQRADKLLPAMSSFFIFFSHNDIFIAWQWRQRWSMWVAMGAAMVDAHVN